MNTLTVDREQLAARIFEFTMNPLVESLGNLTPQAINDLAAGDSRLASRIRVIQEDAENLALESFSAANDDEVESSFYLLDFCAPRALTKLCQNIESETQLWAMGEYLLSQFPEVREDPEFAVQNLIYDRLKSSLIDVIEQLIGGAIRPSSLPMGASAAFGPVKSVNLYETVIVHGTWANSAPWWRELSGQQNFWAYVKQYCPSLFGTGSEFAWSGMNTHSGREQGARDFINWWYTVGSPKSLQVISHSHGCNVVYLACVMEPKLHIANLVSLGGPVRTWYPPPIDPISGISRIHNVYSRFDTTQLLGSIGGRRGEGRTLADSSRIRNHHVAWQDPGVKVQQVWHSDLHEPVVWHGNALAAKTLL